MLGIGLGAFVDGVGQGIQFREHIEQNRSRQRIRKIGNEARGAYDSAVAAGDEQGGNFQEFWMKYALPKMQAEILMAGDVEGARKLQEWGTSEAANKGGKLFASALFKAQTGDHAGAMQDVIAAGKIKGYIDSEFEIISGELLQDKATSEIKAVALTVRDGSGKERLSEIPIDQFPQTIATIGNPVSAFQTNQAAAKKKADTAEKRKSDREDFEFQERTKAGYSKAYAATYKELMANDWDFAKLSDKEKDQRVRDKLGLQNKYADEKKVGGGIAPSPGTTAATGIGLEGAARTITPQQVLRDTVTGQHVERSITPAPGQGGTNTPAPDPVIVGAQPIGSGTDKEAAIRASAERQRAGADPHAERQKLLDMGITQDDIDRIRP